MALQAPHIRFGVDIKDKLKVTDLRKYVSGIIYPDSRYITKIDRRLTHPESFLDDDFYKLDDFRKGCYTHLLYDKIAAEYFIKILDEYFTDVEEYQEMGNKFWTRLTTLKILQDMEDVRFFSINDYLPYLDYVENLNGEDVNLLLKYNQFIQKMYAKPEQISIETYIRFFAFLGVSKEIVDKLEEQIVIHQNDLKIKEFLKTAHDQILANYLAG